MRANNINLNKLLKYIMVLSVLYFSQTGVITYAKYPKYSNYVMILSFLFVMIVFALKVIYLKIGIPAWAVWWGIICILLYMITMIITEDYRTGYILLVMNILLGIAFCSIYSREEFYQIFVNCMVGISILGMVSSYILLPFLKSGIPVISNESAQYYDLVLSYQIIIPEKNRLNIVWTEPGVLAVYLSFALILAFFLTKKVRVWKKAVLLLAMICTQSSSGYVFMILILGTWFIEKVVNRTDIKKMILLVCAMVVGAITLSIVFANELSIILDKFNWYSMEFIGRFGPIVYNLDRGIHSPLWGWGFQEGRFYLKYSFYTGTLFCNTSTTTQLFHYFGMIIPLFTVIASFFITGTKKTKWYIRILLTFILLLSVNFESLVLDQIYTVFLFSIFMKGEGQEYEDSLDKFNSNSSGVQSIRTSIQL